MKALSTGNYISMNMKRFFSAVLALVLLLALCACSSELVPNRVLEAKDMQGKAVGVIASTPASGYLTPFSEEMTIKYFTNVAGMSEDLLSGAIDCAVTDRDTADAVLKDHADLTMLEEPFINREYRMAVSQDNTVLRDNINATLEAMKTDGTLNAIIDGWLSGQYEYAAKEYTPQGVLTVAVDPTFPPYGFSGENGEYLGMEIDILREICYRLGVELQLVRADEDNMVYLVESGKVALAMGRITVAEDAAVIYTDVYLTSMQVILVRDS